MVGRFLKIRIFFSKKATKFWPPRMQSSNVPTTQTEGGWDMAGGVDNKIMNVPLTVTTNRGNCFVKLTAPTAYWCYS